MDFRIGDIWYGKEGTDYEGFRAKIHDVTSRYVQLGFTPPLNQKGAPVHGKPLGKRQFSRNFTAQKQITIFDVLEDQ